MRMHMRMAQGMPSPADHGATPAPHFAPLPVVFPTASFPDMAVWLRTECAHLLLDLATGACGAAPFLEPCQLRPPSAASSQSTLTCERASAVLCVFTCTCSPVSAQQQCSITGMKALPLAACRRRHRLRF
jgi:hypothetical protein